MSLLLDTPLLRQESFTTCWFAAGRMVKAYGVRDAEDRAEHLEIATRLQRTEGVFVNHQGDDAQWLMAKLAQGKKFRNDRTVYERAAKPANKRVMGVLKQFLPELPDFGLDFYFRGELDRYCRTEKLTRDSTHAFITELIAIPDEQVAMRVENPNFLYTQFYRLQALLDRRGPLVVSLSLPGSGISHAHVITGVLKTAPGHEAPNRFDGGAYSAGQESTTAPQGYWVVLNDPSGSGAAIYDLAMSDDAERDMDERPHVQAEQYRVPLSLFMLQMLVDYSERLDSTKLGKPNHGSACSPPSFVYDPKNATVRRTQALPAECTDRGVVAPTFV